MTVKVIVKIREGDDSNDWRQVYKVEAVDDQGSRVALSFHDGEPEDANIARDFNDVLSIPDIIKLAHQAGVHGEVLNVETVTMEKDEY